MSLIRLPHLAAALVAGFVGVSIVQADVVLNVQPVTVNSPVSGTDIFTDVVLKLTNGTTAPSIVTFTSAVKLTSTGGTGASIVAAEYNGGPFPSGGAFSMADVGEVFFGNDTGSATPVMVDDGSVLFKVKLHLDAGAVGTYSMDIDPEWTELAANAIDMIAFVPASGTLTINPVPEPASLGLLGIAGLGLLRRRRMA